MGKVTSKLQVTVPKAIADRYGIRPGDEIDWVPAGDSLRVVTGKAARSRLELAQRLKLFDAATSRQARRQGARQVSVPAKGRGWRREELYDRGRAR